MRTIAVVNQKGGCGKTTVSINLASALADLGKKVLLVDMDPQSHCAVGLAVPEEQIEQSIYDVLISESRNEPMRLTEILWQIGERLELAPASIDLSAFEQQMAGIPDRECCLKKVLDGVTNDYDFTVIDCPPAVSLLTFNALRAATDVVVPVETGYFALHGLSKQLETLSILCKRCQQQVSVRVLASMYDIRTKMAREILAELRSHFSDRMFKTVVNFNTRIKEAASFGQPINEYDPASKGQQDFRSLAQELIGADERLVTKSKRLVDTLADQLESIGASATELLRKTQPQGPARPASVAPPAPSTVRPEPPAAVAPKPATPPAPQGIAPPVVKPPAEPVAAPVTATPVFADEQSERPVSAGASSETPIEAFAAVPATTDTKLSDYYGVNQIRDAVVFVTLYPRASSVQIAGDFNNWQPAATSMERVGNSGVWQAKLKLPHGTYRYRLVVDGQWQQDPYNERTELNPYGEFNSVLEVQ
ncbi:MAG TPA: AAA family ATPase [Sedimentisphaerales bacterium]|nr:AAA family ATPase [Sedimentisphaerales bacterium]HRS12716.1 AAA family ATPase [Sedimentisphaerales bacterium]HRV49302.1 AAA family ATPase [Sedimentisphaerales bacterium]